MARAKVTLFTTCLILVSSCVQHDGDGKGQPDSQLTTTPLPICRLVAPSETRPGALAEVTIEHGGRTCFKSDTVVLFVPSMDGGCDFLSGLNPTDIRVVEDSLASHEFLSCNAFVRPSSSQTSHSITYVRSDEATDSEIDLFRDFSLDLIALTTNDGLPITHYAMFEKMICMETSDPARAMSHIDQLLTYERGTIERHVDTRPCKDLSPVLQNLEWPTPTMER